MRSGLLVSVFAAVSVASASETVEKRQIVAPLYAPNGARPYYAPPPPPAPVTYPYGYQYGYNNNGYYNNGYVTLYSDSFFRGRADRLYAPAGQCVNVNRRFNDRASSIRANGRTCTVYRDYNCRGGAYPIGRGGASNFRDVGINDSVSSLVCY